MTSGNPGACVDAPPVLQVDSLTMYPGLALLSVVCQASVRGLLFTTGPVCSSKDRIHIGSESF